MINGVKVTRLESTVMPSKEGTNSKGRPNVRNANKHHTVREEVNVVMGMRKMFDMYA